VLDYQTQQQRLIPLLASCYALHFAKGVLVDKYCDAKRTKVGAGRPRSAAAPGQRPCAGRCAPLAGPCCRLPPAQPHGGTPRHSTAPQDAPATRHRTRIGPPPSPHQA
jgi:hypothetical protein